MNKLKLAVGWLFLLLSIFIVFKLAHDSRWYGHLVVDIVGQYIGHAHHFIKYGNLKNLGYNEYQPGAVIFFAFLSPSLLIKDSYESLLNALFAANIIFIIFIAVLYLLIKKPHSLWLLGLILLATGPIALFRFDLLVFWLILTAVYYWHKNEVCLAQIFLGLATLVKIYPAIILPYFLILSLKKGDYKGMVMQILGFGLGIAVGLAIYIGLFQAQPKEIFEALSIHSRKPVHVESVWATFLTIWPKVFTGKYATGGGNWGIFGISPENTYLPLTFYNYFWILPTLAVYLYLLKKLKPDSRFTAFIPMLLCLQFLIFSKILTPQYLLWFSLFFPALNLSKYPNKFLWIIDLGLIIIIALLSQYIYPLNYNRLLDGFYTKGSDISVFWTLAVRNILLVILYFKLIYQLRWQIT